MSAADWTSIEIPQDIRLVVADMDGTLLDEHSEIPQGFWPMLARLRSRGVEFVPASGRQYATLRAMFADKAAQVLDGGELSYIAENGNVVAIDGNIAEVHGVDTDVTRWTIDTVNASAAAGESNMGLVLCGLRTAYVQRTDKPFLDEVGKYYAALEIVDDLHSVLEDVIASNGESDTMLKLAILDFDDAEAMAAEKLTPLKNDYQVVVSGKLWVDIMNATTNKKQGVEALRHCGPNGGIWRLSQRFADAFGRAVVVRHGQCAPRVETSRAFCGSIQCRSRGASGCRQTDCVRKPFLRN